LLLADKRQFWWLFDFLWLVKIKGRVVFDRSGSSGVLEPAL